MNTLSWFIYGIHLVDSLNFTLGFILTVLFIVGTLKLIGLTATYETVKSDKYPYYTTKATGDRVTISIKSIIILWFLFIGVDVIVPSRQTMILIAASEVGEKLAINEKVGSFVDPSLELLKTWIEKERHDLLESMKPSVKEKK